VIENKRLKNPDNPGIRPPQNGYLPTQIEPVSGSESVAPRTLKLSGHVVRRKAPKTEQIFWDSELPGFGLRCSPTGHKSWIVRFRERGIKRLVTLGKADAMSVHVARIKARKHLADNLLDGLPVRPARLPNASLTVADFVDEFLQVHSRNWKPRTLKRSLRALERQVLPTFGPMAVAEVSRADIARWRDSMASRTGSFNRALPVLSVLFKVAEKLGYRPRGSNPCKNTSVYKRKQPERFLSPAEYRALGALLRDAEGEMPQIVAIIRLLIYTGARVGEICALKWEWVKPPRIFLPDSKTGARIIYLNGPACDILESVAPAKRTGPVFPGMFREDRTMPVQRLWPKLRSRAGLHDVRIHDLRHSFASLAIREGVPLTVIGKLLGHALPETMVRYAHLADDAVSEAADRVCGSIAAKMGMQQ
jgi:integrase